jgi:hypothetical protein
MRRVLVLALSAIALSGAACGRRSSVPAALTNQEFWGLIETLSEPPGAFNLSDNLVSNEPHYPDVVRSLREADGVYIGVGPEQNFSYIARLRPAMAFIVDIRRENRNLHLLYKALFELSADRADFVSRLFSRPRPDGLAPSATVDAIFERFDSVPASIEQWQRNAALVRDLLVKTRGFHLSQADIADIERILQAFRADGPAIQFWGARPVDPDSIRPSYRQLMTARDVAGQQRSYLASDDSFAFVKELQSKNLMVPIVGDFAGPGAIRRIGDYVRSHGDTVRAFYASNVGVYLNNEQTRAFCANLSTLPAAPGAWFIDGDGAESLRSKLRECPGVPK